MEKGLGREAADPLKEANRNIANSLSKYWNQEKLSIELRPETDISTPAKPIRKIYLDFIGGEVRRSSISDQSPGTRWFMAFIVKYLANQPGERDILLLLDEPGILLHAGAQKDLLERFENTHSRLQIIYTTHSPYMINKNFPLRVRCVDKGDGIDNDIRGTYVDQKPYASPKCRAWEPIRSSLGILLGDSLFVGGINLIVEGITDQIILSSAIQVINNIEKKVIFDINNVSITFAGDTRNLVALAIFCNQETQGMKVLLDGDTGAETRKKLIKAKIDKDLIFIMNEIIDEKTIDIENLFDPNFYHDCVLEAYQELVSFGICKNLPKNWADVERKFSDRGDDEKKKWGHSKYYEEYFDNEKEPGGFDKVLVSKKLADKIMSLGEDEQKKIVKPLEILIKKIWRQKPSWP